MAKLTDTQLILLSAAAQRPDGGVVAITDRAATSRLVKAGLLSLGDKTAELPLWQNAKDGRPQSLFLTDRGREVIGVSESGEGSQAVPAKGTKKIAAKTKTASPSKKPTKESVPGKKPGGKLAVLISLLSRAKGVGLEEMTKATGWQAHSVRGAISGALKKKQGLNIVSEATAKGRTYRIAR